MIRYGICYVCRVMTVHKELLKLDHFTDMGYSAASLLNFGEYLLLLDEGFKKVALSEDCRSALRHWNWLAT